MACPRVKERATLVVQETEYIQELPAPFQSDTVISRGSVAPPGMSTAIEDDQEYHFPRSSYRYGHKKVQGITRVQIPGPFPAWCAVRIYNTGIEPLYVCWHGNNPDFAIPIEANGIQRPVFRTPVIEGQRARVLDLDVISDADEPLKKFYIQVE